jgi:Glycosyl hydrolases family 39
MLKIHPVEVSRGRVVWARFLILFLSVFFVRSITAQSLLLDFNTPGQYTDNFNNPNSGNPCTETNAGGVGNSGALLVTGGDGNATYNASSWNFATNGATISASLMVLIQQAAGTGNKIQLGVVNSVNSGFADTSTGNGWIFGSFRLLPQSTSTPTYQLAYQTATNGSTSGANVGSVITLIAGHWYQFNVFLTNTGPGVSYNLACNLIDYGTSGETMNTNVFAFNTLQTVTGTSAALASDSTVYPAFRVADDTGAAALDNFSVVGGGANNTNPPVITAQPVSKSATVGSSVTFTVSASYATSYQWLTNGVPDPAGTSPNYTLNNISSAENGMTLQATVSNTYGSTNSSVAVLTVTPYPVVNLTINCASNLGPVNPNVWGVGGPDKYIWYAGNTTLEQEIQAAGIKLLRIDPIQNCLYNGIDPYPATNDWNFTGLDAILSTIFASGAQPVFTICDFPGGISYYTNSSGYITNANWNAYATFMSGVVNRYNVQKVLGTNNSVHFWEMWNEPELEPDGKFVSQSEYGAFVQTVGSAMKAVDPTIKLIGPVADDTDFSPSGWIAYTAQNLSAQIDILCWHDYGPSAAGTSNSVYMNWTPLNYQTNMETVTSGDGGIFEGPGGKLYPGAITEYNMSFADNGATFDLMYHDDFDATFAASAIVNAMKGGANLFAFYNLVSSGTDLTGLLDNSNYLPYLPYYTFYLFGNYFGNQFLSSTGGASTLESIASEKTIAGTYTVMVVNKDTSNTTYQVNFNLNNIPSPNGLVLIHAVNATNDPVSWLGTAAYTNSSFSYIVSPYSVTAFEFDPPPQLQETISNNDLVLSWNTPIGTLQSTPALAGASSVWSAVTTNNPAVLPMGSAATFFRVVEP